MRILEKLERASFVICIKYIVEQHLLVKEKTIRWTDTLILS